ncbi:GMC oxidoreductase [Nocardia sp. NBC_01388]|uniref:GMC oxidoreductase n=1 Tax=Nocardia sp. NBC_01388 TaxID=2903596 RepID=UPI003862DD67
MNAGWPPDTASACALRRRPSSAATAASLCAGQDLGGANMGSVCDLDGRVHGQRGLYVLDGALMPGNTAACNPSMTIAAVAERALDHLVAQDVGTVF